MATAMKEVDWVKYEKHLQDKEIEPWAEVEGRMAECDEKFDFQYLLFKEDGEYVTRVTQTWNAIMFLATGNYVGRDGKLYDKNKELVK